MSKTLYEAMRWKILKYRKHLANMPGGLTALNYVIDRQWDYGDLCRFYDHTLEPHLRRNNLLDSTAPVCGL